MPILLRPVRSSQRTERIGNLLRIGRIRLTRQGREYLQIWVDDDNMGCTEIYVWSSMPVFKYLKYASEHPHRQRGKTGVLGLRIRCTHLARWGSEYRNDCFKVTFVSCISIMRRNCKLCFSKSFLYEHELLDHLRKVHRRQSLTDNTPQANLESPESEKHEEREIELDSDGECEVRAARRKTAPGRPRTTFYSGGSFEF